ncbi:MarR family winged helix-turn-helix transcriptional regulator [Liberiplasma polymorphum]|uniref:MarR family winged helix-turn-helix transcriptional regulator n=1 Tax=Liberiplasma polymorphum TaxID=3374570 RepID=UPI0037737DE1
MDKELFRLSFNKFLKMYFDSCKEIYTELDNIELLTDKQFRYLKMIDQKNEVTMGELADLFQLSKPTVTEMIKRFEDTGLINKRKCDTDGRVSYISLTEQGKTLANSNKLESQRAVEKIFAKLTKEELQILQGMFDKIGQV